MSDTKPGDGLREFATMILRDGVRSSRLADYLQFLLEEQLTEPDAQARSWARSVPVQFSDASPEDLAAILGQLATQLDTAKS